MMSGIAELVAQQRARQTHLTDELSAITEQIAQGVIRGQDMTTLRERHFSISQEIASIPAIIAQLELVAAKELRESQQQAYSALLARIDEAQVQVTALEGEIAPLRGQLASLEKRLFVAQRLLSDLEHEKRDVAVGLAAVGVQV